MAINSHLTRAPSIITPFDKKRGLEFSHVNRNNRTSLGNISIHPPELEDSETQTLESTRATELRKEILSGKVLTLTNDFASPQNQEFSEAVFTGNLLYALKTPDMIVIPSNVEEIQSAVNFARINKIKLTVKNGGHSYAGYSLSLKGIVLDMQKFNKVTNVDKSGKIKTVTIQGGCRWIDVYNYFEKEGHKEMVIGGLCTSVGVSGFTLGGGLSPFSRSYGLGIDNVLKMKVVTAAGKFVELKREDECKKNRDLFWAMLGGGGGNFGILVEFTTQIHDLKNGDGMVACGSLTWELPDQESDFMKMMKEFNTIDWPNELTMDAIWQYKPKNSNPQATETTLHAELTVIYNGTKEQFKEVVKPLISYGCRVDVESMLWHQWVHKQEGYGTTSPVFHQHTAFIFAKDAITPKLVTDIISVMKKTYAFIGEPVNGEVQGKAHVLWDHIGGQTTTIGPKDTAFFWRDGYYVSNFKLQWNDRHRTGEMLAFIDQVRDILLPYSIQEKAVYVNYIDRGSKNWSEAYYGDNYPRLQRVKKEWDPYNFFNFEQSIRLPEDDTDQESSNEDPKRYLLPNPDLIWRVENPTRERILMAYREQLAIAERRSERILDIAASEMNNFE